MAEKNRLRLNRAGSVINLTSRQQESALGQALTLVLVALAEEFDTKLVHDKSWSLKDIVHKLRLDFPDVEFYEPTARTSINPDGGILSIVDRDNRRYPVLISEVKNQGTNDLRLAEGKAKQAKGNAIERLGKNVIGVRTAMLSESIVPFVCFGYGVDFEPGSTILDRVATIAMYGHLNRVSVVNEGEGGLFNRGSFFFREQEWGVEEMTPVLLEIARRSIFYYYARYGSDRFKPDDVITTP